jgi:hypothetical protein
VTWRRSARRRATAACSASPRAWPDRPIDLRILISTWPIEPFRLTKRLPSISCASNAARRRAIRAVESGDMSHGVTVPWPAAGRRRLRWDRRAWAGAQEFHLRYPKTACEASCRAKGALPPAHGRQGDAMFLLVSVTQSIQDGLDRIGGYVPNVIGALVVLLVGWLVARAVGHLVERLLRGGRASSALRRPPLDRVWPGGDPAPAMGRVAYWVLLALTLMVALSTLGIGALTAAMDSFISYLPNVVAAVLIMLVAIALAGAVSGLVERLMEDTMLGHLVGATVPLLIVTVALFMALVQLRIATQIVTATYVLVLGAIALGFALAFGLGGRDVARLMLLSAYESGGRAAPQLREDARLARRRAADEARVARERAEAAQEGQERTVVFEPSEPDDTPTL